MPRQHRCLLSPQSIWPAIPAAGTRSRFCRVGSSAPAWPTSLCWSATPSRDYAWVLSRTPQMAEADL